MNFVKSHVWFCLAICLSAALLARGQNVISDSAASDKLAISPANPRLLRNSPLQFIATFKGKAVKSGVLWTTSNSGVATVDSQGNATLLAPGTSTVTASRGALWASTVLTVTTASNPIFSGQPKDTNVSAVIDAGTGVQVQLLDSLGGPLAGQSITVSIGSNPPGTGVLSGALAQTTNASGTATFPDLRIDWLGSGYTLVARANPTSGPVSGSSAGFNELRVGDPCLGPTAACASACADTDGDGLNDAWEIGGGIDLNGDGKIDAQYDLLLPGADPQKQDLYVQYDWMDYSTPGIACSTDTDCLKPGSGHSGEVCSGPQVVPTQTGSCAYACTADIDCAARGSGHALEKCVANACVHTHDPDRLAPGALQAAVDSYQAHGVALHLLRGHGLPHSTVVSFRLNSQLTESCEGASLQGGAVGEGKYAESLYDLKTISSMDALKIAYHYALFGHYSGCDSPDHCLSCPPALNPDGSTKNQPGTFGASGLAEISGNDFIVSLGGRFQDLRHEPGIFDLGSTFMHELGHNLGLRHGGGVDTSCKTPGDACPIAGICTSTPYGNRCLQGDDTNAKPNYLSVMNYRYQFTGITQASNVGSIVPVSQRLDYSTQTLPTGGNTPGSLDQSTVANLPAFGDPGLGLSEPAGLGSGNADIITFTSSLESGIPLLAPSEGPVDWDQDIDLGELHIQADTNCGPGGFGDHYCAIPQYPRLFGHTDWGPNGQNQFTYQFQCTPYGGPNGDGASTPTPFPQNEMSTEAAMQAHVDLPPRSAQVVIRRKCTDKRMEPGAEGLIEVALLGGGDFDVNEVDSSSLYFHGAKPLRITIQDFNGDGIPDLLAVFDSTKVRLHSEAKSAHLQGWFKNSQIFIGEGQITIVPSMPLADANCH
jgi:hypothetical protein